MTDTPPTNTQRVMRVADLPQGREQKAYILARGGGAETKISVMKRKRQVLDLLMQGPVYCASPVRISDVVHILKRDTGLEVETKFFPGDPVVGSGNYGVYILKTDVRHGNDAPKFSGVAA